MLKKDKLFGLEVFLLDYYGIHTFIGVGDVIYDTNEVYIYELNTKKIKTSDGYYMERLDFNYRTNTFRGKDKKDTLIVPEDAVNTFSGRAMKVKYQIRDDKIVIPIEVTLNSRMYKAAIRKGTYSEYEIIPGTFYAGMICDGEHWSIQKLIDTAFCEPCELEYEVTPSCGYDA